MCKCFQYVCVSVYTCKSHFMFNYQESNGVPDNHQDKMPSNEEEDPLAFPSLPNKVLRKMGLEAKSTENG